MGKLNKQAQRNQNLILTQRETMNCSLMWGNDSSDWRSLGLLPGPLLRVKNTDLMLII